MGKRVFVKEYVQVMIVYYDNEKKCEIVKDSSLKQYQVDILHYIKTLSKKPSAIKRSQALRNNKLLEEIFINNYENNPKKFIKVIKKAKEVDNAIMLIKTDIPVLSGKVLEEDQVTIQIDQEMNDINELLGVM